MSLAPKRGIPVGSNYSISDDESVMSPLSAPLLWVQSSDHGGTDPTSPVVQYIEAGSDEIEVGTRDQTGAGTPLADVLRATVDSLDPATKADIPGRVSKLLEGGGGENTVSLYRNGGRSVWLTTDRVCGMLVYKCVRTKNTQLVNELLREQMYLRGLQLTCRICSGRVSAGGFNKDNTKKCVMCNNVLSLVGMNW